MFFLVKIKITYQVEKKNANLLMPKTLPNTTKNGIKFYLVFLQFIEYSDLVVLLIVL